MNPANFPRNRQRKQNEAKERQAAWDAITLIDQLHNLDRRPGKAVKQRAKIQKKIIELKAIQSTKK